MELPFAGLHQLCSPFLRLLDRLPVPQRDALQTAFGMREGNGARPVHGGTRRPTLLSEVAESQPLICVIDDAQWLDRASTQTLTFVARRLLAESVAVVFALREFGTQQDLSGLAGPLHRRASGRRLACPVADGGDLAARPPGSGSDRRRGARQPARATRAAARSVAGRTHRRIRCDLRHPTTASNRGELPGTCGTPS